MKQERDNRLPHGDPFGLKQLWVGPLFYFLIVGASVFLFSYLHSISIPIETYLSTWGLIGDILFLIGSSVVLVLGVMIFFIPPLMLICILFFYAVNRLGDLLWGPLDETEGLREWLLKRQLEKMANGAGGDVVTVGDSQEYASKMASLENRFSIHGFGEGSWDFLKNDWAFPPYSDNVSASLIISCDPLFWDEENMASLLSRVGATGQTKICFVFREDGFNEQALVRLLGEHRFCLLQKVTPFALRDGRYFEVVAEE